ncbi:Glycosyltransferase, GT2 family [Pedobacter westerhofensis]|uniref:Glycosyltransferase, GT2 family n=1 Tax=Pedobacter westerhofensis TaxID=425512 RepID=A0A521C8E5_9SPHI|nr:glycosyltransferase family 2 protein [Pedobacter westerhofensis]SMO55752.1 Glycosyltransferase, GT2 family [Pedobacter westerhofensis]
MENFSNIITISIPVYERYDFFEEAVASAVNQTVKCKIVIVDNCSTHNKFKEHIDSLNNPDIEFYRNESNLGMIGNWNKCIDHAETEWVTILHDDDALYPNFVECFEMVRKVYPDSSCISSGYVRGYKSDRKLSTPLDITSLKVRLFETQEFNYNILSLFPGIAINVKLYNFRFDQSEFPVSDFDLWVRLSKAGDIIKFDLVQAYYRLDKSQSTSKIIESIIKGAYSYRKRKIIPKNYLDKIFFLATTSMSALSSKKLYNTKIDLYNFVEKEDKALIKLFETTFFLYLAYVLKYSIYRFGLFFKFKRILKTK